MVRQNQAVCVELLNGRIEQAFELWRIIHVRGIVTRGIKHLGQRGAAQAVLATGR